MCIRESLRYCLTDVLFFFQAEDGIRDRSPSRGLGDVYKRQGLEACLKEHTAAVKALAWSPHQNGVLISGGGTSDQRIKIWNTMTLNCVNTIHTGSQVCNLVFSKNTNEFVSTHGYSKNHVVLWKYSTLKKVHVIEGHSSRVLYLTLSADGRMIATGAADETIKLWDMFPARKFDDCSPLFPSNYDIRQERIARDIHLFPSRLNFVTSNCVFAFFLSLFQ
eukprot:TRINITY_DN4918_c0_g1_i1.p2 TRINITY_DN4918_c0_g1~~TRINITY_DN4918_c0_g1_i1.p2  ORF type:complete len:220 (-),score=55.13 TRINITY_DN4918_c0_g1_i1:10-669(-)